MGGGYLGGGPSGGRAGWSPARSHPSLRPGCGCMGAKRSVRVTTLTRPMRQVARPSRTVSLSTSVEACASCSCCSVGEGRREKSLRTRRGPSRLAALSALSVAVTPRRSPNAREVIPSLAAEQATVEVERPDVDVGPDGAQAPCKTAGHGTRPCAAWCCVVLPWRPAGCTLWRAGRSSAAGGSGRPRKRVSITSALCVTLKERLEHGHRNQRLYCTWRKRNVSRCPKRFRWPRWPPWWAIVP
jgi:hypothetical protein